MAEMNTPKDGNVFLIGDSAGATHVFHVNIRLPIADRCNRDQIRFFRALIR